MTTVAAECTRTFVDYAAKRGVARGGLLEGSGITESALRDPNGRIAVASDEAIWRTAQGILAEEALGLRYAVERGVDSLQGVVAIVACAATDIEGALRVIADYHRLLRDDGTVTFSKTHEIGTLRWRPDREESCLPEIEDAFLASCILLARAWTGTRIVPARIRFQRPRPASTAEYDALFACPLEFGGRTTELVFSVTSLGLALRTEHQPVARYLEMAAEAFAARLQEGRSLKEEVVAALAAVGTEISDVARHLDTSVRTLQRHLLESGTSYKSLVDDYRRKNALELLGDPSRTIVEIAHAVGFSDVRSLRRALRRWRDSA